MVLAGAGMVGTTGVSVGASVGAGAAVAGASVAGILVGASTLGSVAVSGIEGGRVTVAGVCRMGWGTALLSSFAISMTAFLVSSPHCNVGIVGGFWRMARMSEVAWRKKSSRLTAGKGMIVGKNFTVSACRTRCVDGM